jgi:hypothetical protein
VSFAQQIHERMVDVRQLRDNVSFSLKPADIFIVKPSYTYLIAKDDLTEKWLPCKPKHKVKIDFICNPTKNFF